MASQLDVRAADFQFALDRVVEGVGRLKGHVDVSRIAAVGHSFGGATAVATAAREFDGPPCGEVRVLNRPFLLLQRDYAVTGHGDTFMNRNHLLLDQTSASAWRYEILGANHIVSMDLLLYFTSTANWALSRIFGGNLFGCSRGPMENAAHSR